MPRFARSALGAILSLVACAVLAGCTLSAMAPSPALGPVAGPAGEDGAEEWTLPAKPPGETMRALVYRPPGDGPFPLVIVSHGTVQDPARRKAASMPGFPSLTRWFLAHGYVVVVPQRPGHGGSGRYLEAQGGCERADFVRAANGAADSIGAAVDFMRRQAFVRPQGTVLAGHSAGALGSLAYAARRPGGIRAVVNFAGGLGGRHLDRPGNNCAPERLVAALGLWGRSVRVPTLWIYAENDTYFPPALSRQMVEAFRNSGGRADYELLPPAAGEGHFAIRGDAWSGILETFLAATP